MQSFEPFHAGACLAQSRSRCFPPPNTMQIKINLNMKRDGLSRSTRIKSQNVRDQEDEQRPFGERAAARCSQIGHLATIGSHELDHNGHVTAISPGGIFWVRHNPTKMAAQFASLAVVRGSAVGWKTWLQRDGSVGCFCFWHPAVLLTRCTQACCRIYGGRRQSCGRAPDVLLQTWVPTRETLQVVTATTGR